MTAGMLDGKRALVAGVANKRSIAWAIAQALHGAGAELAFTYQGERLEGSVRKLAAEVGSEDVIECDVSDDESIDRAFAAVAAAGRHRHHGALDRLRPAGDVHRPLRQHVPRGLPRSPTTCRPTR